MIYWGVNANNHDSSLSIISDNKILFAAHSERYSRVKNDSDLDSNLIQAALEYGPPDLIIQHENPWNKSLRQLLAGQGIINNSLKKYFKDHTKSKIVSVNHHLSHATAGYFTSGFDRACIIVIDAIGEFETMSIWQAEGSTLTKKFSLKYPDSIGLWYSAMTDRIGLKPNEEEYILMGMAAFGDPNRLYFDIFDDFLKDASYSKIKFKKNLHRGYKDWRPDLTSNQDLFDIAASTQRVYEKLFEFILNKARYLVPSKNLVLMGGCALNCSANPIAFEYFNDIWIMPNPGDAGSSLGAILAHTKKHIEWKDAFLGHNIEPTTDIDQIVDYLIEHKICGVAQGREEFGPRAFGNRSLLADPRGPDIKDRVNQIKRRQEFRPFAPMILEEYVTEHFEILGSPRHHRYMQYTSKCRHPKQFPAIVHKDGTSRIQSVPKDGSRIRKLLELWFLKTGCPILLNTSLNIKGKPLVHDIKDAKDFENEHNVRVFI